MNTDFKNGKELLEFCEKEKISISRAMLLRESDQTEKTESSIYTRMPVGILIVSPGLSSKSTGL